jgi:hypothetical protein
MDWKTVNKNKESADTPRDAAKKIVAQMSHDDKANFKPKAWKDGVGNMLIDRWEGLELLDVLDEIVMEIRNIHKTAP